MSDLKPVMRDGKVVMNGRKAVMASRCLPETITVTLSGFADAFPDRSEIPLTISSCFGSGAAGHVSAPPPDAAAGAVSDPIITDGGSGYAVLGRIEPNIKLTVVGPGSGAEVTPVITEDEDACGRPVWVVNSVTIDNAGSGYDDTTYIDVQVGNFPEYKATASSVTGTGARLRVAWVGGTNWTVAGVEIIAAGTGYTVGDTFTVGTGVTLTVATVGGSGQILSLTHNQTETYPVLDSFGSPAFTVQLPRSEPTLELEDNGSGAVLTVNVGVLSAVPPLSWQITSVTVVNGGSDDYYTDGDYILVAEDLLNAGEGTEQLVVRTNRSEPVYELSGGNNDATLTPSYTANGYGAPNETWYMDSVAVGAGGTGYSDEEYLTVSPSDPYRDVDLDTPSVKVRTVRDEPAVFLTPASVTGSGASISLTMTQGTDFEGRDSWSVTGTSIDSAGTGYTVGDTFTIDTSNGNTISSGTVEVTSVDTGGEILAVSITDGGEYWLDTGVVDEAVVDWPGEGYHDDGSIHSIQVVDGGQFWEIGITVDSVTVDDAGESYTEDPAEPPLLADVTVTVNDTNDPPGTGATLTVSINSDVESPQFGQITGATVTAGGSGYNGNLWVKRCCGTWDGRSIVLKKGQRSCENSLASSCETPDDPDLYYHDNEPACWMSHRFCTGSTVSHSRGGVRVVYRGPDSAPIVYAEQELNCGVAGDDSEPYSFCNETMTSTTFVAVDEPFEFTATAPSGATAVVTEGGTYDDNALYNGPCSCNTCCGNDAAVPDEITASVTGATPTTLFSWSKDAIDHDWDYILTGVPDGDYVLSRTSCRTYSGEFTVPLAGLFAGAFDPGEATENLDILMSVSLESCRGFGGGPKQITPVLSDGTLSDAVKCNKCSGCRVTAWAQIYPDHPPNSTWSPVRSGATEPLFSYDPGTDCDSICQQNLCPGGNPLSIDFYGKEITVTGEGAFGEPEYTVQPYSHVFTLDVGVA